MRPDQLQRLQDLSERLADVFLSEADPDNWTAGGKLPCDLTREERGDRHWDRKGAMGTGAVLRYTLDILNRQPSGGGDREQDDAMDASIREAEQRAAKALARVMDKARGKDEFDRRAHGEA